MTVLKCVCRGQHLTGDDDDDDNDDGEKLYLLRMALHTTTEITISCKKKTLENYIIV